MPCHYKSADPRAHPTKANATHIESGVAGQVLQREGPLFNVPQCWFLRLSAGQ
jgi:hypothetical protein